MDDTVPDSIGNYTLKSEISSGSIATVWLGEHNLLKRTVAVKIISRNSLTTAEMRNRLVRELSIMKQVDHPFIVKLYEVINTDTHTFILQEFAEGGSLLNFVNTHGKLPEAHARHYFSQLLCALEYLHDEQMIVYRDLKAENVLLDRNMNIRLIDFSFSQPFNKLSRELRTACGAPAYTAPEMIRGGLYTKCADIWSAGIFLYALTVGQLPYEDGSVQGIMQKIAFTEPFYPPYLSSQLTDLLQRILVKNPDNRLTLSQIKQHPWLAQKGCQIFLSSRFTKNDKFTTKVERELVDEVVKYEGNVRELTRQILEEEYNSATAMYAILRREVVTQRLKDLVGPLKAIDLSKLHATSKPKPAIPKPVFKTKVPRHNRSKGNDNFPKFRSTTIISPRRFTDKSDEESAESRPRDVKFPFPIKHRRTFSLNQ